MKFIGSALVLVFLLPLQGTAQERKDSLSEDGATFAIPRADTVV